MRKIRRVNYNYINEIRYYLLNKCIKLSCLASEKIQAAILKVANKIYRGEYDFTDPKNIDLLKECFNKTENEAYSKDFNHTKYANTIYDKMKFNPRLKNISKEQFVEITDLNKLPLAHINEFVAENKIAIENIVKETLKTSVEPIKYNNCSSNSNIITANCKDK